MDFTECMQHGCTLIATEEIYEYIFYRPPWCSLKAVILKIQEPPVIPVRSFRTLYFNFIS